METKDMVKNFEESAVSKEDQEFEELKKLIEKSKDHDIFRKAMINYIKAAVRK